PGACAGAMAHILLPSRSLARDTSNPAKFPETAVPLLVERLVALGADPRRLVAKLAGGASMFAALMLPGAVQMGERNVDAARAERHPARGGRGGGAARVPRGGHGARRVRRGAQGARARPRPRDHGPR